MKPLAHEFLVSFDEAVRFVRRYAGRDDVTRATLISWLDKSRANESLEFACLSGELYTSREALQRFLAANSQHMESERGRQVRYAS